MSVFAGAKRIRKPKEDKEPKKPRRKGEANDDK